MSNLTDRRASDAVWLLAHDLFDEDGGIEPLWKQPKAVIERYKVSAMAKLVEKFAGGMSEPWPG